MRAPRTRPLIARPGARFHCAGDGVCCTDVHAVGPLSRKERGVFAGMHDGLVVRVGRQALLSSGQGGRCPFLEETGCALHARLGSGAKPRVCVRFPFGLVATPVGGRVTTSHRCSCRTLGPRPPLSLVEAEEALRFPSGRLFAEIQVAGPIELTAGRSVPFGAFLDRESELIQELLACDAPRTWLAKQARPEAVDSIDRERARELASAGTATRFSAAIAWFGHAVEAQAGVAPARWPSRPWQQELDRAEARTPRPEPASLERRAHEILADFAADEIWGLEWCGKQPLDATLAQLGRRLELAEILIEALTRLGVRTDRAAAEAVMILELADGADAPEGGGA